MLLIRLQVTVEFESRYSNFHARKWFWQCRILLAAIFFVPTLQWRHNKLNGVSNHQPNTIVYLTVCSGTYQRKHQSSASLAFFSGNSPVTDEFPTQKASNAQIVPIWWRHHKCVNHIDMITAERDGWKYLTRNTNIEFQKSLIFVVIW